MKFYHLHNHSEYSLLDGLAKIDQMLERAKELKMDALALTDHGNLYGAVEFFQKAKKEGIKPIIGAELYLAYEKMTQKRPNIDNKRYHLVVLVKNQTGYKNLVKLITASHLEGFYYKPRVDEEFLEKYSEGLIGLSACLQGKIPQLILAGQIDQARETALTYKKIFKGDFYLELQHHPNIPEQKKVNQYLIKFSKKLKIPLIATNDCHYLKKEDAKAQDILMLINTSARPDDPERITMIADDFSMRTQEEMISAFKNLPEAIKNTQKIVEDCNFEFEFHKIKFPKFQIPEGKKEDEYLKELCLKGLEEKKDKIKNLKEAKERLEYELSIIKKSGFASYFLIVQDFVNWAKKQRILVGPARGSVGGSLVAYLLNITEIDPLKYGLLFERFLNPEGRISPPDIDLDFTDIRRDEVINYLVEKYGRNQVAQIITFGRMAARAVVRDVGRALEYPYSYCDKIAKLIPFGKTLDETLKLVPEFREIYENDPKAKTLIDFAKKLEGVARHASTHACGVVVSSEPLDEIVPLQHPTQDDSNIVTQYEMRSIEDLGLLKIDLLGLKNLTIIEETLKKIYSIYQKEIDIEKIPLDDKKTYKLLQEGKTIGVFQLESSGMQKYLKQLKPNQFEDIIAIIALYRPGPLQFISDYIAGKHQQKKIEYLHPKLKPILESTYGVLIYQEQVMKIAQQLAGFSLTEADILRKAIGKKQKSLLVSQEEKFIEGCKKNGINEKMAQKIWSWIEPFAHYSFNRSHSCAYALIAYQTAYLKAHWPTEFMASLLSAEQNDVERIGFLIEECKKMGIEVLPPDINESFRNFSVVPQKNQIRFGLLAIKNVGTNTVEAIIKERRERGQFRSFSDFLERIPPQDLNKKSLEALIKAGVFDRFEKRNVLLQNLEEILNFKKELSKSQNEKQKTLFGQTNCASLRFKQTKEEDEYQKLLWEKELLGLYVSSHPLKKFKKVLEKKVINISELEKGLVGKKIRVAGIIDRIKRILTKNGSNMLFVQLEDYTGKIEAVVFPDLLERNFEIFQKNKIVIAEGRLDNKDGIPKIICETIEEIIEKNN